MRNVSQAKSFAFFMYCEAKLLRRLFSIENKYAPSGLTPQNFSAGIQIHMPCAAKLFPCGTFPVYGILLHVARMTTSFGYVSYYKVICVSFH